MTPLLSLTRADVYALDGAWETLAGTLLNDILANLDPENRVAVSVTTSSGSVTGTLAGPAGVIGDATQVRVITPGDAFEVGLDEVAAIEVPAVESIFASDCEGHAEAVVDLMARIVEVSGISAPTLVDAHPTPADGCVMIRGAGAEPICLEFQDIAGAWKTWALQAFDRNLHPSYREGARGFLCGQWEDRVIIDGYVAGQVLDVALRQHLSAAS